MLVVLLDDEVDVVVDPEVVVVVPPELEVPPPVVGVVVVVEPEVVVVVPPSSPPLVVVDPEAVAEYAINGHVLAKGNVGEEQPMQGTLALIHQLTPLFHLRLGHRLMLSASLPWQPKFQKQPVWPTAVAPARLCRGQVLCTFAVP